MKTGRAAIVAVLIVSLLAAGATRRWSDALRMKGSATSASTEGGGSSFSAMNSFALALLLGGLRGPLVMFLWTSSEAQKSENNLEAFDTKVEWIRLLQPEFDTVHIFQIWNKAYNISVKMSSLGNKYVTILDALEYAHRVDRERPNDINIIAAIAGVYFDKLGSSTEKAYYTKRVRQESLPHPSRQSLRRNDPAWRRLDLDPILDASRNVLAKYLEPTGIKLVDPQNPNQTYDGSELQFLPIYQPYPYGVPPLALAYNYYKRAQLLQLIGNQRHAQLSDLVIDSRPALSLKSWAESDAEQGRRQELEAIGKPAAAAVERTDLELPAARIPLSEKIVNKPALDEAIYMYGRSASVARDADGEYAQHIARYKNNFQLYESHRDGLKALAFLCDADCKFLQLLSGQAEQKDALRAGAVSDYRNSIQANQLILLKYYVTDGVAQQVFPQGVTKYNVEEKLPAEQRGPLLAKVFTFHQTNRVPLEGEEDINEYLNYIRRAEARLTTLQAH
jgi:hypothetical protein